MNKVGLIGYGSMGSMLVNGFLTSGVLSPDQVVVSTRTRAKIDPLGIEWPGIQLAKDNRSVAREAEILFICVKPLDVLPVLAEIKFELHSDTHLVSIAACVTLADVETLFDGKITKVIPSLTSEVRQGISLACHNDQVQKEDGNRVEELLAGIGRVIRIEEKDLEAAIDLTSCAPAIIAAIFKNYVDAGLRNSSLSSQTVHEMVLATLFGTVTLLLDKQLDFSEMISRVATKGGITEEAVQVIDKHLPGIFDEVFQRTLEKQNKIKALVRTQSIEIKTKLQ